jgi:hypothetical protein
MVLGVVWWHCCWLLLVAPCHCCCPEAAPITTLRAEAHSGGVGIWDDKLTDILEKKTNWLVEEKKTTKLQKYLLAQRTASIIWAPVLWCGVFEVGAVVAVGGWTESDGWKRHCGLLVVVGIVWQVVPLSFFQAQA